MLLIGATDHFYSDCSFFNCLHVTRMFTSHTNFSIDLISKITHNFNSLYFSLTLVVNLKSYFGWTSYNLHNRNMASHVSYLHTANPLVIYTPDTWDYHRSFSLHFAWCSDVSWQPAMDAELKVCSEKCKTNCDDYFLLFYILSQIFQHPIARLLNSGTVEQN